MDLNELYDFLGEESIDNEGCEKYTTKEELSVLGKYLKKKSEENLEEFKENGFPKDPSTLEGNKEPDFLDKSVERIDENKIYGLNRTREPLNTNGGVSKLDKSIEPLSQKNYKNQATPDYVEPLDKKGGDITRLPNDISKLNKGNSFNDLPNSIEKLTKGKEVTPTTSSTVPLLDNKKEISFSQSLELLSKGSSGELDKLSQDIEFLEGEKRDKLPRGEVQPLIGESIEVLPESGVESLSAEGGLKELSKTIDELSIGKGISHLPQDIVPISNPSTVPPLSNLVYPIPNQEYQTQAPTLGVEPIPEDLSDVDLGQAEGELYDTIIGIPENQGGNANEADQSIRILPPNLSTQEEPSLGIVPLPKNLNLGQLNQELYNQTIELLDETGLSAGEESSGWNQKIQSLLSAYLSGGDDSYPEITNERAEEFENKLIETLRLGNDIVNMPEHVNMFGLDNIRALAEKSLGSISSITGLGSINASARSRLLFETFVALYLTRSLVLQESGAAPWILPGNKGILQYGIEGALSGGPGGSVKGAIQNIVGNAGNIVSDLLGSEESPRNSPPRHGEPIKGWDGVGSRPSETALEEQQSTNSFGKNLVNILKDDILPSIVGNVLSGFGVGRSNRISFAKNYLVGSGIKTTLEELCLKSGGDVDSLDGLLKALKESPYITTAGKVTTTSEGRYKAQTLDSNNIWEVILEPYLGPENGYISFLPAFHEINTRNLKQHGVITRYSKWIPFNSFDLQRSRMESKELPLYSGEVYFPVNSYFTNEIRLSIVDDQYKSWKSYFEKCYDVSVYSSTAHDLDYYIQGAGRLTAVDKTYNCCAMYKNLTFRCRIYVMTPQYSTIRKFDLLLLLKEFSVDYVGDIDSGASDLNLVFSVVGENPMTNVIEEGTTFLDKGGIAKKKNDFSPGIVINTGISLGMKLIKP